MGESMKKMVWEAEILALEANPYLTLSGKRPLTNPLNL